MSDRLTDMYSIVIQAGGKSSRMGQDKSFIRVCGKPLIQLVIEKVSSLSNDLIVTSNEPEKFFNFNVKVVQDEYSGVGALAGLHAGIKAAKFDLVIAVANDMPFINLDLFTYMQHQILPDFDVVIPYTKDGYEPFHAIYRKSTCLHAIENAIQNQERRIISWFNYVKVFQINDAEVKKFDPKGLAFFNINTIEDFNNAIKLLG